MNFVNTDLSGLVVIEPKVFLDERGCFFESYNQKLFLKAGIDANFVQDNQSESSYGVIRGLHGQVGAHMQAKLVRVLAGKILDVAVDIRPESPSYGQYDSVELSAQNKKQLYIPQGFLHGFAVLSKDCVVAYKCDRLYCKEAEISVCWNDAQLNIDWQLPAESIKVSARDKAAIEFKDVINYRR